MFFDVTSPEETAFFRGRKCYRGFESHPLRHPLVECPLATKPSRPWKLSGSCDGGIPGRILPLPDAGGPVSIGMAGHAARSLRPPAGQAPRLRPGPQFMIFRKKSTCRRHGSQTVSHPRARTGAPRSAVGC